MYLLVDFRGETLFWFELIGEHGGESEHFVLHIFETVSERTSAECGS